MCDFLFFKVSQHLTNRFQISFFFKTFPNFCTTNCTVSKSSFKNFNLIPNFKTSLIRKHTWKFNYLFWQKFLGTGSCKNNNNFEMNNLNRIVLLSFLKLFLKPVFQKLNCKNIIIKFLSVCTLISGLIGNFKSKIFKSILFPVLIASLIDIIHFNMSYFDKAI